MNMEFKHVLILGLPIWFMLLVGNVRSDEAVVDPVVEAPEQAEVAIGNAVIPVFELSGPMLDGVSEPSMFDVMSMAVEPMTMYDLHSALWMARDDDEVPVVVFMIDDASIGLSQLQSLRREFMGLKEAGKEVWMYTKSLGLGTLLLGAEATRFVLMPEGDVMLNGLYSEQMFFKGLLDKVGVQADLLHVGDFKSAGEPFTRNEPSEESIEQTNQLLDSLYAQLIGQIAESRELAPEAMVTLMDKGVVTPAEVLEAGLVDALQYRTDFAKQLRRTFGRKSDIRFDYGMESGTPEITGIMDMLALFSSRGAAVPNKPAKSVALVVFEGEVTAETVAPVRKAILQATRDKSVRALVLRINSPGGSAMESEVLWEATEEFKKTGRPFVVSMGDVAASGGYYVAALGDPIYAEPGTITGSIGVVGGKFVIKDLMDWAGIGTFGFRRGKHADLFTSTRPWNPEERTLIQESMEAVYTLFKKRVQEGRKDRLTAPLETLAGGRVYTGEQALQIGLVDQIGGLPDAIIAAAEAAKLDENYEILVLPESKDIFQLLSEVFGQGAGEKDEFLRLESGLAPRSRSLHFLQDPQWSALIRFLDQNDPVKSRVLRRSLRWMDVLSLEGKLLISPVPLLRLK